MLAMQQLQLHILKKSGDDRPWQNSGGVSTFVLYLGDAIKHGQL